MPAWPGGPCPSCGDEMPGNLVRCRTCGTLLNPSLELESIEVPPFVPLPEIGSMVEVELSGYYIDCPQCRRELRVDSKYLDEKVQCKFCDSRFQMDFAKSTLRMQGFYAMCPHCKEELRATPKYLGMKVACKHCQGKIHFLDPSEE